MVNRNLLHYSYGIFPSLFLSVLLVTGCSKQPEPVENAYSWPGEQWDVSTLEAEGFEPAPVNQFVAELKAGKYGLVDQFLMIRNGRVVVDEKFPRDYAAVATAVKPEEKIGLNTRDPQYDYDHPDWHPYYNGTDMHSLQSVTKSVTSMALGLAIDMGYIESVNTPAMPYFKEYEHDLSDPRKNAMTIEDLLTMRSGIDWKTEGGYQDTTHSTVDLENSGQWIDFILQHPMDEDPGSTFEYNDGASVLLGKIVSVATGKRIDKWAENYLFAPLGVTSHYWKITPDGEADTEGGLFLSAHDLARIGYLFLRNGVWQGEQFLSVDWVNQSVTAHVVDVAPDNDEMNYSYGYQWWLPERAPDEPLFYSGLGFGGQRLTVIPDLDIIIVFNAWDIRNDYGVPEQTLRRKILPEALKRR